MLGGWVAGWLDGVFDACSSILLLIALAMVNDASPRVNIDGQENDPVVHESDGIQPFSPSSKINHSAASKYQDDEHLSLPVLTTTTNSNAFVFTAIAPAPSLCSRRDSDSSFAQLNQSSPMKSSPSRLNGERGDDDGDDENSFCGTTEVDLVVATDHEEQSEAHRDHLMNLAPFDGELVYNGINQRQSERFRKLEELLSDLSEIIGEVEEVVQYTYSTANQEIEQQFNEGLQRVQIVEQEQDRLRMQISSFIDVVSREYAKIFENAFSSDSSG